MQSIARLLPLLIVITAFADFAIPAAQGQAGFHRNRLFDTLQRQERRARYRPDVQIERRGGDRIFRSGETFTVSYRVKLGWVGKIEIRSGLKVVKTISINRSKGGVFRTSLRASDFQRVGKGGKKMKFKIWAWQGQGGNQSVHGESIGYTLVE